jgi:hypothetical protein
MIVISNASPIIILYRVSLLDLLQKLYGKIIVSSEVLSEIIGKPEKPGSVEIKKAKWIKKVEVKTRNLVSQYHKGSLSISDASVISLAKEIKPDLLIIDDDAVRKIALKEGFNVTGTVGILIKAKIKGLIPNVKIFLERLAKEDFRMSKKVYQEALREAGE